LASVPGYSKPIKNMVEKWYSPWDSLEFSRLGGADKALNPGGQRKKWRRKARCPSKIKKEGNKSEWGDGGSRGKGGSGILATRGKDRKRK